MRASAPGRLDFMGGFADYSGSLVLQIPIAERATVRVRPRADAVWAATTRQVEAAGGRARVEMACPPDLPRAEFLRRLGGGWAAYVLGAARLLREEYGLPDGGLEMEVDSRVPAGKGVASSAALVVAALHALARRFGLNLDDLTLPRLAQQVENGLAGAPCGRMDMLACHLGRAHRLLPILCRPDTVRTPLALPPGWQVAGVDSGVRHAIGDGASYTEVRTAAFMGYALLASALGARPEDLAEARRTGDASALPGGGYLVALAPRFTGAELDRLLPETLTGADFLVRGLVSPDPVTAVDPARAYAVRACARHPLEEHARVERMAALLASGDPDPEEVGALLAASHAGYTACRLGHAATDRIADAVRRLGPAQGLLGAKISGGGSGGTVGVLLRGEEGVAALHRLAAELAPPGGPPPRVFLGSSEGARFTPP
jgi:L-arabinokinase